MIRRTPRATLTETRFPYTTLVLAACTGRPLVNSSPPEKFTPAENARNLSRRHRGHPVQRCVRLVRPERPHFGSRHQPAEEFRQGGEPLLVGDDAGTTEAVQVAELAEPRSEEHTSELQSLMRISYAVFCLKKKTTKPPPSYH